jgi:L-2-hydroxycarboxylate dehydrogenase (NAD+)
MGRVQQFRREGKPLPPMAAVDKDGNPTTDANAAVSLLPFGAHKGYGLSLINELVGALVGGSLPTVRGHPQSDGDKHECVFFFQAIHPEALSAGAFARGRDQEQNVKAVIGDILGHGNDRAMLPGQPEADWAKKTAAAGGLLFTRAEIDAFREMAAECGQTAWRIEELKTVSV